VDKGAELPLAGGFEIHIPPGTFRPRNLTADKETGIGNLSDGEIARTLRYGVNHDHEAVFPFMPYQNMSVDDMTAVISYLRTIPAVHHEVPPTEYNFLGKFIKTFVFKPEPPVDPAPKGIPRDSTPEYGKYLATCVANCYGCHTNRDLRSGKFIGKPFAGGTAFPPSVESYNNGFITPNLTPDKETGVISEWNETGFINRMHAGRRVKGSPMPWGPFSRMDDIDLKAIYRYLQTVEPVKKVILKTVFKPGEKMDEYKD
jgi:mono/diheme cytochrome c family protein